MKAAYSACNVGGQTYDDGDSMQLYKGDLQSGECHQCTCRKGELIDCHHIFRCLFNDSSCKSYSLAEPRKQCCPTCERGIADSSISRRINQGGREGGYFHNKLFSINQSNFFSNGVTLNSYKTDELAIVALLKIAY